MLNLDTHIVVFAVTDELRPRERALLEREPWSISAIVFWELAKLTQLGRISLEFDSPETIRVLSRLHVWPIDLEIARASARLDFRSDPADELIAATSVVHGIPLLTRDRVLRASNIVPLASFPQLENYPRKTSPSATLNPLITAEASVSFSP